MRMRAFKTTSNRKSGSRWRPYLETLEARRLLTVWADFNGDGFSDLAIGVTGEDVGSVVNAGAVNVIYGTVNGLAAADNQIWHLDSPWVIDFPGDFDRFGWALAAADFNGDGFDDLAIGAPYRDMFGDADAGGVWILSGSAGGLTATPSRHLHQDYPRVRDAAEPGDLFGSTLAAGDFDNDGYVDLAVGVPGEEVSGMAEAGAVHIFYGTPDGLSPRRNRLFHQDSGGVGSAAEPFDHFGAALAAGDTNGDGYAELFVGVPDEDVNGVANIGGMQVLHGSADGLHRVGNQNWIHTGADANDHFAFSIGSGDFNNDGYDDVAVGLPGKDLGSVVDAGLVTTWYGSAAGLTNQVYENWSQDEIGGSTPEDGDQFGFTLAIYSGGAGGEDLIVGTPFEDIGAIQDAGSISVMYGPFGFAGFEYFTQGASVGNGTVSEAGDLFGYSLAAGNFDGDLLGDLAIGTPNKDIGAIANAGVVTVLYGEFGDGLSSIGSQLWHQDSPGIQGVAENGDVFGAAAAAGSKSNPSGGRAATRGQIAIVQDPEDTTVSSINSLRTNSDGARVVASSDSVESIAPKLQPSDRAVITAQRADHWDPLDESVHTFRVLE